MGRPARVSAAQNADGRRGKKTSGRAPADTHGTRLTPAAFAPDVYTNGWRRHAFPAAGGRRTLTGMRRGEGGAVTYAKCSGADPSAKGGPQDDTSKRSKINQDDSHRRKRLQ